VVTERRRPVLMVECQWADAPLDRGVRYPAERFPTAEAWQVSATGQKDSLAPIGVRVAACVGAAPYPGVSRPAGNALGRRFGPTTMPLG